MMGIFSYYAGDSFLHRRNPTIKLLSLMVMMLAVTLAFDPWTPLVFFVTALLALRILGRAPLPQIVRPLLFFLALGGLGFMGSNAFFYAPVGDQPLTVLWSAGPLQITAEGLRVGVSLTIRMLAIVIYSIIFVTTTDPTDLVLSLIQQARFPFRLGYGILVAYRFLPLWRSELDIIRAAHRIRGAGERMTLRGRWEQLRRYAVPLLAGAIRKSERVAIAMDARAFGARPERTYYRQLAVVRADWAMLAGTILLTGLILVAMQQAGLLMGYGFVPAE
jgi:energy-coupling factor transport system permease protein